MSTVSDDVEVDNSDMPQWDSRTQLGSGLPLREGGGGHAVTVDCGIGVVGGPASAFLSGTDRCVDFAGEVAVRVKSPAVRPEVPDGKTVFSRGRSGVRLHSVVVNCH